MLYSARSSFSDILRVCFALHALHCSARLRSSHPTLCSLSLLFYDSLNGTLSSAGSITLSSYSACPFVPSGLFLRFLSLPSLVVVLPSRYVGIFSTPFLAWIYFYLLRRLDIFLRLDISIFSTFLFSSYFEILRFRFPPPISKSTRNILILLRYDLRYISSSSFYVFFCDAPNFLPRFPIPFRYITLSLFIPSGIPCRLGFLVPSRSPQIIMLSSFYLNTYI